MQNKVKSFRELVESKTPNDDYEPLSLWLIPLYLRSRKQYYDEAADSIKKHIDELWEKVRDIFPSRDEFEKTDSVDSIWARYTPYWWGLNDVVGWIDIRLCVRKRQIQLSSFLSAKRVSRKLKDKKYGFQSIEVIDLSEIATNEELQNIVLDKLNSMSHDKSIRKLFVDLKPLYRVICHTDLVGIIQEFAREDCETVSENENAG